VPWSMRGPRWEAEEGDSLVDAPDSCAHCGERLGEGRVTLVHHRGEHRIPDAFCSVDHMIAWAKSGGRWS
jgi:hypothetical protein